MHSLSVQQLPAIQTAQELRSSSNSPPFSDLILAQEVRAPSSSTLFFYGYSILIGTWTVVLLGIASMLGAFDKYFPFESDTKTYPIKSYYPSLIIMTFIVSWIWCVVSWVGMKFFRHTKGGLAKKDE